MLDTDALADLIAELVGDQVAKATGPLLERIAQLEEAARSRLDGFERDAPAMIQREAGPILEALVAALPPAAAGKDGQDGKDGVGIDDITATQDGSVFELSFIRGDIAHTFQLEIPAGPAGPPGQDGRDGVDGKDGALPPVKAWTDGVHYAGDVVTCAGATWQAVRDTGKAPGSDDWTCLASAGADGQPGKSPAFLGTWSAENTYSALDVVALNGASFVAKRDDPGECPGDGWQLMAAQGKRGQPGERGLGLKGDRGQPGPGIVAISVDDQGLLTLVNADGSTVECDLYPILARVSG
jgi:hypothetical protein